MGAGSPRIGCQVFHRQSFQMFGGSNRVRHGSRKKFSRVDRVPVAFTVLRPDGLGKAKYFPGCGPFLRRWRLSLMLKIKVL